MQWYNRITRRLISPDQYTAGNLGYQPGRSVARDTMIRMFSRLKFSSRRARSDNPASVDDLINTTHQFVEEVEPILQAPPYLIEAPTPQRRRSSARREDVGASGSRSQRRRSSTGPHDLPQHFTAPQSVPTSYDAYTGQDVSTAGPHGQHFTTPQPVPTSYGTYTGQDVSTAGPHGQHFTTPQPVPTSYGTYTGQGPHGQHFTTPQPVPTSYSAYTGQGSASGQQAQDCYVPQPGADMHTPTQQYDAFAPTMQTESFMSMFDFDSNAYQRGDLGRRPNYNPSPIPFYSTGVNTEQITNEEWDEDVPINLPRRSQRERWPTHCGTGGHKNHP
ncbi:hypothetical protein ACS0TY_019321 [Phlomoides rotata]